MHKIKKQGPWEMTQEKQNLNQTRRKEGRESSWHLFTLTIAKYWDDYILFHIQDSQLGLHSSEIENRNLFNLHNKKLRNQWLLPLIQLLSDSIGDQGSFCSAIIHKLPITLWLQDGCCIPKHHIQCSNQNEERGKGFIPVRHCPVFVFVF